MSAVFDIESVIPFPTNFDRGPFRKVSWELELCGAVFDAMDLLKEQGFCHPYRETYHYRPGKTFKKLLYVKSDSTVDGEFVFERLDFTDETHARAFLEAMHLLNSLSGRNGSLRLNQNCGGHIHVDANNYGMFDLLRLLELVGHIEETLFRIAGAGYARGHRSLLGNSYSIPVEKIPQDYPVKDKLVRLLRLNRYAAINGISLVEGYDGDCFCPVVLDLEKRSFTSFSETSIGSFIDLKQCAHRNSTVEWRVFNATLKPEIFLAWVCLTQACHAYCWRPADSSEYFDILGLKPRSWTGLPWERLCKKELEEIEKSVDFIFRELPLFEWEKELLAFVLYKYTKLKMLGRSAFWDTLARYPFKAPLFVDPSSPDLPRKIVVSYEL